MLIRDLADDSIALGRENARLRARCKALEAAGTVLANATSFRETARRAWLDLLRDKPDAGEE